jgi:hypothetical protein
MDTALQAHNQRSARVWSSGGAACKRISLALKARHWPARA